MEGYLIKRLYIIEGIVYNGRLCDYSCVFKLQVVCRCPGVNCFVVYHSTCLTRCGTGTQNAREGESTSDGSKP